MPHVCGDEPRFLAYTLLTANVCPTYVGMNRGSSPTRACPFRMPHVCGDEPRSTTNVVKMQTYAPRMWG